MVRGSFLKCLLFLMGQVHPEGEIRYRLLYDHEAGQYFVVNKAEWIDYKAGIMTGEFVVKMAVNGREFRTLYDTLRKWQRELFDRIQRGEIEQIGNKIATQIQQDEDVAAAGEKSGAEGVRDSSPAVDSKERGD